MKRLLVMLAAILLTLLVPGCAHKDGEQEDYHIDFANSEEGVFTAYELIAFFNEGTSDTLNLGASIDIENEMLKLTGSRGEVKILGNGFTITGSGDCVIRMEQGASLHMSELTLISGADGIGCLGDADIYAQNVQIDALKSGIYCAGSLYLEEGSNLTLSADKGCGVTAKGITMGKSCALRASGEQGGVMVTSDDLLVGEDATLSVYTASNYYALKCEHALTLYDGASIHLENAGEYHGAEIGSVFVDGVARINAQGGEKGVGLFVFRQDEDVYVLGESSPAPRYESGLGRIVFVDSAVDIPAGDIVAEANATP